MFLPFEGLYAEIVRRGLVEELQRNYKVNISGPTTMSAMLSIQINLTKAGLFQIENIINENKEYCFNYKKVGSGWRAYILRMPSLRGRNDGSGVIHRLHDNGGYYICWDSQVNTLKDMQIISRRWADNIQEYISTGRF